ncbi:helix-turn-helix domain-containing protein [Rhodococcus sp. BH5]|uniref:helix-turn-helix domain-containing protein n=1 Tax=Rhodococcus sp. BH5 TaxID=2871702 RepID=UPI003FA6C60A
MDDSRVFQERLNYLFKISSGRITNGSVVDSLGKMGCNISRPYLSQLRTGNRVHPSMKVIESLSQVFNVDVEYFFVKPVLSLAQERDNVALIEGIQQVKLRRLLLNYVGLSPSSQLILEDMATILRLSCHMRELPADDVSFGFNSRRVSKSGKKIDN